MFNRIKRILMAEVDAGNGGGGAPASPPTAPAPAPSGNVPQAQGAAPTATKEIADAVAAEVSKLLPALKDSIFAEARRTFTEKRNPKPASDAAPTAPQPELNAADERRMLRDFDRALTKLKLTDTVSAGQWSRAEKALLAERPEDVAGWAKDYFEGYGAAQTTTTVPSAPQNVPQQPKPTPLNERPVSDRGTPPAQVPLEEADIWTMSDDDRAALLKAKGPVWYRNKLNEQGRGRKVTFG